MNQILLIADFYMTLSRARIVKVCIRAVGSGEMNGYNHWRQHELVQPRNAGAARPDFLSFPVSLP